ncbi:sulfite exporter TauE/SafE family protein [soil metagenome]
MPESLLPFVPIIFFLVATLYASVGHAGASGYLAVMTLAVGLSEKTAGPTALVLNLIVATLGTIQFQRAGLIPWRQLLPYIVGSIPFAWFASRFVMGDDAYKIIVGLLLLFAAARLLFVTLSNREVHPPHDGVAILVGIVIGALAGLTRTGGGIFLTPVLILMAWAKPKEAAGMSVAFILVNSAAGLTGRLMQPGGIDIPSEAVTWAIAAALGGLLGSWYGAHRSGLVTLRRMLAIVLMLAAMKLLIPGWIALMQRFATSQP